MLGPKNFRRSHARRRASQPTLDIPHVRVSGTVASPVHGLQRCALCVAVACAKFRERVPTARVFSIRELVHAIAGLQVRWRSTQHTRAPSTACKRQWIRLPASAPPPPSNCTRTATTTNHRSQGRTNSACTHRAIALLFRPEGDDALVWFRFAAFRRTLNTANGGHKRVNNTDYDTICMKNKAYKHR